MLLALVVIEIDVRIQLFLKLRLAFEVVSVNAFFLKRPEESLGDGVIVRGAGMREGLCNSMARRNFTHRI